MSDQPITCSQLAKNLGVDPATITRWHQNGIITPVIFEGRTIRFDEADVRRVLEKRAKKAQQARIDKTNLPDGMVPTC